MIRFSSIPPFQPHRADLKARLRVGSFFQKLMLLHRVRCVRRLTLKAPARPVFHNPIQKGFFKADILPKFLTLDPLVLQNFFPLGQKFAIQSGIFEKTFRVWVISTHDACEGPNLEGHPGFLSISLDFLFSQICLERLFHLTPKKKLRTAKGHLIRGP